MINHLPYQLLSYYHKSTKIYNNNVTILLYNIIDHLMSIGHNLIMLYFSPQLTLTVDRVARFQAQLSERIRRRRRTRLTLRSPGGGHRTTAVSFRHGSVGNGTRDVSATHTAVTDTPAVQQMSVAKSDSRILYTESKCY